MPKTYRNRRKELNTRNRQPSLFNPPGMRPDRPGADATIAFIRFATVEYLEKLLGEPKTCGITLPESPATSEYVTLQIIIYIDREPDRSSNLFYDMSGCA